MMKNRVNLSAISLAAATMAIATTSSMSADDKLVYPAAPTSDVVDDYFGMKVADPYRPLENDTAAATLAWVEAENAVTNGYLSKIPFRQALRKQIESYNNYTKQGAPFRWEDSKYYFYRNEGLKNQSVLYRMDTLGDEPTVVLDPNTLSDDGTVALTGISMSKDGKHIAYTISRSGSDWTEIYVIDAETLKPLPDHIEWAKFTGAVWRTDGIDGAKGFFYSAYPRPEAGKEFSNANENHNIYFHKLGTPQTEDTLVFSDPAHPLHFHSAYLTNDERYLILQISGQGIGNGTMFKDMTKADSGWVTVEPSQDYEVSILDITGDTILIQTSYNAPNKRIVTAPTTNPGKENWKDLIPESPGAVITGSGVIYGKRLFVNYEKDAADHPALYKLDGTKIRDIKLPTFGSAGFSLSTDYPDTFYTFTSFLYPATVFSYDLDTDKSELYFSPEIKGFNPDDFVTEQVFYPSADGTKVPMFLTYRKDLKRDGTNPVYLYGYGGFNISLTPGFSPNRLVWLENGGIYAQANLRGGSEYGETWHEAGTKMKKLNVFNDFIAAAEYMIKEGWSSPEHMVIEGGSNGGLLVGAVTNMRPDLFKVAIPRVGVMDMMRYHLFTIGWNWASDYGTSADSPEMASYLLGYSPLHTIKNDGTKYPAVLVTTADHDDRVVPAHSFKYAATLQVSDTGDAPKLIRIDSKAGHGGGKPVSKVIDEYADIYSFIFHNLGMNPKAE